MDNENNPSMTPAQELDQVIDSFNNPGATDGQDASADSTADEQNDAQQQESDPAPQTNQNNNPANAAFAQMRTQNNKLNEIVKAYAELNGLDPGNVDAIATALNDKLTAQKAQKANVPPEFMAEFQQQKAMLNNILRQNAENNLQTAFNGLRTTYNLTNEQAYEFAQTLKEQKFNIDDLSKLDVYYKGINFDKLVEAKVAEALANASANNQYAQQHGATVSGQTGGDTDTGTGDDAADTLAAIMAGLSNNK